MTTDNVTSVQPRPIPDTLTAALSPEWLTAALGTRYPDISITAVTPGPRVSRVSTNARFTVHGDLPDGLNPDLCVKGYFVDLGQGEAAAAGIAEGLFYRDLAERTGIRTLPHVYVDVDVERRIAVLITEDVAARGDVFLDALSDYTLDQLKMSLEIYAQLHSATWMHPDVAQTPWLTPSLRHLRAGRGIPEISYNFGGPIGAGVPERIRDARLLFDSYGVVADEAVEATPWSVIQGDAHVGNVFVDADGRPQLVDWQTVQRGPWYIDVGYHIASAIPIEQRRTHERALVRHYLERLAAHGVTDIPDEDEAWRGVRRGMVHGLYLWGITQKVHPSITTELLTRIGTAVDDHDVFAELARGSR